MDGAEYRVDDSVDTVKVYVLNSGSGKYMIQGAGSSQENAVTWTKEQYETCQGRIRKLTEEKYSWKTAALNLAEAYQRYGNKKEKK